MKYYSGRGDDGFTDIKEGRVRKDENIIELIGKIDTLLSFIGNVLTKEKNKEIAEVLRKVEEDLYLIGGFASGFITKEKKEKLNEEMVKYLENKIDYFGEKLEPIQNFVKPNGSEVATTINICRTLTRECERAAVRANTNQLIIKYLNRLSSLFFVLFRYQNKIDGFKEEYFK